MRIHRPFGTLALAAIALAVAACGSSDEAARRDGVPGSAIPGSALRVGTGAIDAAPLFSLGELEGPPELAFGRVYTIVPTPDRGFLTCDLADQTLRRYDSAGVFLKTIGRTGAGPGEYAGCYDVLVDIDSGIVVNDPPNARLVRFTADGAPRDVISVSTYGGLGGPGTFYVDRDGRYWRKAWIPTPGASELDLPTQMVILDRGGRRVDSLHVPAPGQSGGRGFALSTNDGMYSTVPYDSLYAIGADAAIVTASPHRYHLKIVRGERTLEVTRDVAAVPYGDAERAEWLAWQRYFSGRNPQQQLAPIPELKPFIRAVRVDDIDRVWVQVHVSAEQRPIPPRAPGDARPLLTWRERNTYDLFDSHTGAYIGRVAFPYATQLMATQGDRVWLAEEGASGEQRIGVYDLRAASR
ncbi:MAG TPA: 6-bladed beta-propeller [Gemmatimonadaceae bacterium]|nr:6-bladed beta-propeller [Gemmatimonadaceae bacterium]HRQ77232.1 6-bladed beta-propeller [Gemmatimonadaceae bacterium]